MSNVLGDTTRQQILALGRLGQTLSRIQQTTGVRRETISGYLKAAGIPVRGRGRPSESKPKPAISGVEVSTDSDGAKPATRAEVSTDPAAIPRPGPWAECERVRAVPRADRRGAGAWPQRHGDLAGPGRWPRFSGSLRQRAPI